MGCSWITLELHSITSRKYPVGYILWSEITHVVEVRTLLKCVQPVQSDLGIRLINSAIENDLLGLVARVMTLLKPVIDGRASSELSTPCRAFAWNHSVLTTVT